MRIVQLSSPQRVNRVNQFHKLGQQRLLVRWKPRWKVIEALWNGGNLKCIINGGFFFFICFRYFVIWIVLSNQFEKCNSCRLHWKKKFFFTNLIFKINKLNWNWTELNRYSVLACRTKWNMKKYFLGNLLSKSVVRTGL